MNIWTSIKTDDTLKETVQHGNAAYPFAYYLENIWDFDFHCMDWHWHHELEFVSVTEGTAICYAGTDKAEVPAGCGIFINSSILHRFEATESTWIPNIVFSPALLAGENSLIYRKYILPVLHSSVAGQLLSPDIPWQKEILEILSQVYRLQDTEKNAEFATLRLLLELWDILSQNLDTSAGAKTLHRPNHRQARLQIMMQYIHDNYRRELSLQKIADAASVSKSSALQIFQAGIHLSPVSYLIQYRLMQAAQLLYTTRKPVSAIAQETGFTSAGYFCRKFKERYQMSPNEYRMKRI